MAATATAAATSAELTSTRLVLRASNTTIFIWRFEPQDHDRGRGACLVMFCTPFHQHSMDIDLFLKGCAFLTCLKRSSIRVCQAQACRRSAPRSANTPVLLVVVILISRADACPQQAIIAAKQQQQQQQQQCRLVIH
jgi:hypothetical protein